MTPASTRRVRVLLVDDHPLVRDGIAGLLKAQPEYEVVAEASTVAEALEFCGRERPTLVIVDLRLGDGDGTTVLTFLQRSQVQAYAVVLSAFRSEDDLIAAARCGARAYLTKTSSSADLLGTLRRVMAGEDVLSAEMTRHQRDRLQQKDLTPKELQVLTMVGRGYSNSEICRRCDIGENTVKTHLRKIFDKLGVRNRSQVTAIAIRRGLLDN